MLCISVYAVSLLVTTVIPAKTVEVSSDQDAAWYIDLGGPKEACI